MILYHSTLLPLVSKPDQTAFSLTFSNGEFTCQGERRGPDATRSAQYWRNRTTTGLASMIGTTMSVASRPRIFLCINSRGGFYFYFLFLFCRDPMPYRLEEDRVHAHDTACLYCFTDKLIVD